MEGQPESLVLSVSSTGELCTFGSVTTLDYDIQGGQPPYRLTVDGQTVEQSSHPHYIPCRPSAPWSRLGPPGSDDIQRMIVSVTDANGARAYAVAEHRLVPPLPAPTLLRVSSGLTWDSEVNLSAEWRTPFRSGTQRTTDFAIRWRAEGTSDWTIEHYRSTDRPVFFIRDTWTIDAPLAGERRELQVAQLRHLHDLQAPQVLRWSRSTFVTTAAQPNELQAEATHDSITLSWGPHPVGLAFVAHLSPVGEGQYVRHVDGKRLRLKDGPLFEARFEDLLPDTLYHVEVRLDDESGRYTLEQNQFELRTESAPEGWTAPSRLPTNIAGRFLDDGLEVTWTAPSTGSRYDTLVCAQPAEHLYSRSCEVVPPGEHRARLDSNWWVEGGTFAIEVETKTSPVGATEIDLHVPSYDPDLPTGGAPPSPPQLSKVSWSHLHLEDTRPASWSFRWNQQDANLAEVTWQVDGRRFIRETRRGEFSVSSAYNQVPTEFRVRLLKESTWTPWSADAEISHLNDSQRNERLVERPEVVEVHWDAPADDSEVIGYRLYVKRDFRSTEVIDVGRQVSAEIPIEPTDNWLGVNVATLYAGPLEVVHFFHNSLGLGLPPREPQVLELDVYAEFSTCPPAERAPLDVRWWISGGAPPYTVSIDELLGIETESWRGSFVVECQTGNDGTLLEIPASVVDAYGETADATLSLRDIYYPVPESDFDWLAVEFGPRSVHREQVLLSWDCRYWPYTTVLRWRKAGDEMWTYDPDFAQEREPRDVHRRCRGSLDGLEPLTTYEYQLARLGQVGEFRYPEHPRWSDTQTVTTLGPPQQLLVERQGETVVVNWQRQPDAWAYVVGLQSNGRSWWKRYEASGEPTEQVRFFRIPEDLHFSVELISPPLEDGTESRPEGYDAFWIWAE